MKKSLKSPANGRSKIFEETAIYKGFANNPFGPSTRYINSGNVSMNFTFPILYPTIISIPPHPFNLNLDLQTENAENFVDTEQNLNKNEGRSKRGVLHLYNMVKCATGCNPLSYKGYGCFCGFLGSGHPIDPIDRCCKKHDWCYVNSRCPPFFEYVMPYYWKCYRNTPICAVEHGEWGGRYSCARRLCECDRLLSECLSRYACPRSRALCHSSPWRLLQNAFMIY